MDLEKLGLRVQYLFRHHSGRDAPVSRGLPQRQILERTTALNKSTASLSDIREMRQYGPANSATASKFDDLTPHCLDELQVAWRIYWSIVKEPRVPHGQTPYKTFYPQSYAYDRRCGTTPREGPTIMDRQTTRSAPAMATMEPTSRNAARVVKRIRSRDLHTAILAVIDPHMCICNLLTRENLIVYINAPACPDCQAMMPLKPLLSRSFTRHLPPR